MNPSTESITKPVRTLPENYRLLHSINMTRQTHLLILLNVAAIGLFIVFGWLFFLLWGNLRSLFGVERWPASTSFNPIIVVPLLLLVYAAAITLHEIIHGAFFRLYTGERPRFGFSVFYAYAAAPAWFLPRNQFLVIGLAPLLAITLAGLAVVPWLPSQALWGWWIFVTGNAAGAVGDIYVVARLLRLPEETLVNDNGDTMTIYVPQ